MGIAVAPGLPTNPSGSGLRWNDDLRTLVDGRCALWLVRQHARIVEVSGTAPAFLGFDRADQLIGRSVLDLVHPDDREYVIERITAASGRPVPPALIRILHARGAWRVLDAGGIPVEYHGAPAVLVLARDATLSSRNV